MILSELKNYFVEHKRAAIGDLANRFHTEPDALRGMLATLESKGRVRRIDGKSPCAPCTKCTDGSLEIYEWVD